jgi:uncharacterized membrane protein
MAAKKDSGTLLFVLLIIIASPFIFLYEFFGPVGFWVVLFFVGVALIYWRTTAKKKDAVNFKKLALDTINVRMHPDDMRDINSYLLKRNSQKASLIRKLQIIKDSLDIALSSKKRDIASERMALALKLSTEMKDLEVGLLDVSTSKTINRIISDAEKQFQTNLYLNVAQGHMDKVGKLKTEKARLKYKQQAKDIIIEGLNNPNSNKDCLKEFEIQNLSKQEG